MLIRGEIPIPNPCPPGPTIIGNIGLVDLDLKNNTITTVDSDGKVRTHRILTLAELKRRLRKAIR